MLTHRGERGFVEKSGSPNVTVKTDVCPLDKNARTLCCYKDHISFKGKRLNILYCCLLIFFLKMRNDSDWQAQVLSLKLTFFLTDYLCLCATTLSGSTPLTALLWQQLRANKSAKHTHVRAHKYIQHTSPPNNLMPASTGQVSSCSCSFHLPLPIQQRAAGEVCSTGSRHAAGAAVRQLALGEDREEEVKVGEKV